jgi:hypothetical protein
MFGRGNVPRPAWLPAFAGGGAHVGGLRLVGERGPELEATGPSRIHSSAQLGRMLSGGDELAALRREMAQRGDAERQMTTQGLLLMRRMAAILDEWDAVGVTTVTP